MTTKERQLVARLYDFATLSIQVAKQTINNDKMSGYAYALIAALHMEYDPETSEEAVEYMIQRSNERLKIK